MYHHPNTNNDTDSLEVRVIGGELADREFMTDVIATSLNKSGFTNARAISQYGFPTMGEQHKPKSVLEQVTKLRPDLFKKEILVVPDQKDSGPVTFSASTKDGTSFTIGGEISASEFVEKADGFGALEKIAITGKDSRSLLQAARSVLSTTAVGELTLKLEQEPWMHAQPFKPQYFPPISALPPLKTDESAKASA